MSFPLKELERYNTMSKIKVLQLHPRYNIRRSSISDLGEQIFKALPSEQYTTVNGFFSGRPAEGEPVSCADHSIYFEFTEKQLKGLRLYVLWKLYKYLKKEKFDVVICNRYKPVNVLMTLASFMNIPLCIGIVHGFGDYDRPYRRNQIRKRINKNWRFIGVSPAVQEYLVSLKAGFTSENTVSITNAIDTQEAIKSQLSKEEARKTLHIPPCKILIGALGRLVPVKGHKYLIEAFAMISSDFLNVDLVIMGEGREKDSLQSLIDKYELKNRVHLIGFVEDALTYVKGFDIWVMPSLEEGLGLALLEGMVGGLPVIASDVPAMRPLIQGANGILVEPRNSRALADAIMSVLELTDDERLKLGETALSYVENEHSLKEFQERYLDVISSAINKL